MHDIMYKSTLVGYAITCNHFHRRPTSLSPRHVLQHHAFQTALFYLMFNLPLTKNSQDHQTQQNPDEKQYCHSRSRISRTPYPPIGGPKIQSPHHLAPQRKLRSPN